jgi:hypothetical protein
MATPLFDGSSSQFIDYSPRFRVPGAIVSNPLLNLPEGRVIVFAMDASQETSEHRRARNPDGLFSGGLGILANLIWRSASLRHSMGMLGEGPVLD